MCSLWPSSMLSTLSSCRCRMSGTGQCSPQRRIGLSDSRDTVIGFRTFQLDTTRTHHLVFRSPDHKTHNRFVRHLVFETSNILCKTGSHYLHDQVHTRRIDSHYCTYQDYTLDTQQTYPNIQCSVSIPVRTNLYTREPIRCIRHSTTCWLNRSQPRIGGMSSSPFRSCSGRTDTLRRRQ